MRWMRGPNGWTLAVCEVDLRVGGAFRYVWRKPNGREMGAGGIYRASSRRAQLSTASCSTTTGPAAKPK